jgi:hypothetical protein
MHTVDAEQVLRQLRQELPSDATVAWDLTRDQCYRAAFNSPTLMAAGHFMAEAEFQYIQPDGTPATSPDRFNIASIFLEDAGTPPDPEKSCWLAHWSSVGSVRAGKIIDSQPMDELLDQPLGRGCRHVTAAASQNTVRLLKGCISFK